MKGFIFIISLASWSACSAYSNFVRPVQQALAIRDAEQEKWESAQNRLRMLLTDNPNNSSILYDLGVASYRLKEFEPAYSYFTAATIQENCPLDLKKQAYFNQGNAAFQLKHLEQALDAYEQVLIIDPDNEQARHNRELVKQLLEQKKQEEQQKKEQEEQEKKEQDEKKQEEKEDKNKQCDKGSQDKKNQDKKDKGQQDKDKKSSDKNKSQDGSGKQIKTSKIKVNKSKIGARSKKILVSQNRMTKKMVIKVNLQIQKKKSKAIASSNKVILANHRMVTRKMEIRVSRQNQKKSNKGIINNQMVVKSPKLRKILI